ncbi:hypothetical protein EDD85DRAFT_798555 [Armillaria nabsnona]|nr:hypothetical protein EDD85DRAFT_798555 [Armillaria nabsnona]
MPLGNSAGLQSLSGVLENKEFRVPDLSHRLLPLDGVTVGTKRQKKASPFDLSMSWKHDPLSSTALFRGKSAPTKTPANPVPISDTPTTATSAVFRPKSLRMSQRDLDFALESVRRSTEASCDGIAGKCFERYGVQATERKKETIGMAIFVLRHLRGTQQLQQADGLICMGLIHTHNDVSVIKEFYRGMKTPIVEEFRKLVVGLGSKNGVPGRRQ